MVFVDLLQRDPMANSSAKRFPLNSKDYELYEEVGDGVSATVYRARCIPLNETVAVKVLDLERCRNDLDVIRKEVHTMSLIDHPNLLKSHCSFIDNCSLWIVMPYMSSGSCFHMMKSAYPEGFEQPVIATLLREVLKALVYLHNQGHIHRDVKAGNILLDSKGMIKLGDFGVSACMFDSGERKHTRNTFVGTPCWMAPEVMQQTDGYDFKADIWSFGITALELAHGHAPFSKYPPMKVLLMTLQNAPPRLDYERDKKFSKSFKEMVAACLVKDPKKRPTSVKLLKHPFFKHARSSEYLTRKILNSLTPLGERYRRLKENDTELIFQNKGINVYKEQLSQQEYMRGISAWNFDLDDLRKQAALIQDDEICYAENQDFLSNQICGFEDAAVPEGSPHVQRSTSMPVERSYKSNYTNSVCSEEDQTNGTNQQFPQRLPTSFPIQFRQTLGNRVDIHPKKHNALCSSSRRVLGSSASGQPLEPLSSLDDNQTKSTEFDPISLGSSNGFVNLLLGPSPNSVAGTPASILPLLQSLLQQNDMQREKVTRLIRHIDQTAGNSAEIFNAGPNMEQLQMSPSTRERELQSKVISLQQSVVKLVEELQRQKTINAQLENQINVLMRSKIPYKGIYTTNGS